VEVHTHFEHIVPRPVGPACWETNTAYGRLHRTGAPSLSQLNPNLSQLNPNKHRVRASPPDSAASPLSASADANNSGGTAQTNGELLRHLSVWVLSSLRVFLALPLCPLLGDLDAKYNPDHEMASVLARCSMSKAYCESVQMIFKSHCPDSLCMDLSTWLSWVTVGIPNLSRLHPNLSQFNRSSPPG
jgi:hypothetical protein